MSKVKVDKVSDKEDRTPSVFAEVESVFENLRKRAFELFAGRGFQEGHDLDDWLRAEKELGMPAAEMKETDAAYAIEVALPGFDSDDVAVTATPEALIIKASHEDKSESKEKDKVFKSSFTSRELYRRFDFPETVDVASVNASLKRGLLKISAPKTPESKTERRRIQISTAA